MIDPPAPQLGLALLAWTWGGGWLVAIWACWTGRWTALAEGHTADAWNTVLAGHAASFVLVGVTLATGAAWPLVPAAIAFLVGLMLYLAGTVVDLPWLEPQWLRERRGSRRRRR